MAFHMGAGTQLAIGKESAWGTPVADTMLISFTSEDLAPSVDKKEEDNLLAATAAAAYDLMTLRAGGGFGAVLKPENAGFILKAALGGTDTVTQNDGGVTGQHKHSIALVAADGTLPSYTVYVNRKQAVKKFSGWKLDTLKLSAKAGDYVRFTVTGKAKDEAAGTITSTTVPSKKAYKFIGGTVTAGGTALDVTGVDLDYSNALEDGPQTNVSGTYATEPVHGKRKISIAIEMPYDANSETIRNTNFLAETVLSSIVLHLESPEIIASTSKYRMDMTLNNVAVLDASVNVGGTGPLTISIKGEATAVGATAPLACVVYDNQTAAY